MQERSSDHFPVPLRGWVAEDPVVLKDRKIFVLRVEEAMWNGRWHPCPGRIRISLREEGGRVRLRFGDRIEVPARLRRPKPFRNPGAFDYRRYLEGEGTHLLGTVKSARLVRRLPGREGRAAVPVHRLRERLLRRLEKAFPGEGGEEPRRFLEAILLGERGGGEGEFEKLFRKTGVYHILSISGLHFALLLGGIGRGVRSLPGGRRLAPGAVGAAALLYVALSGGEDPILRSALSAFFAAAGRRTGRRISAWDAQALAAILLLALHPLHLFDPGFQLSFAATFGILSCRRSGRGFPGALPWIGKPLQTSSAAWASSMPVLAAEFFQVSPIALVLNLAAAPFLSGALFLGGCLLLAPFRWMALGLHFLLGAFSGLCEASLRLPGSFYRVPPPGGVVLLAYGTLALVHRILQAAPGEPPGRRMRFFLLASILWLGISPQIPRRPEGIELQALDVGQGDALLLRLPGGENVLVDAGGFTGTDFDVGEKVVVPALLSLGVTSLERVVLTHAHQDHGGGIPAVVEAFPPRQIWTGRVPSRTPLLDRIAGAAAGRSIPILHPTRGAVACFGEACFQVLHPPAGFRDGAEVSNDDSLVLRLTYRRWSILLAGDIEREGESHLLASGSPLRSDLLKVPHHGSPSSTSPALLDAIGPEVALISVGEGNLWGHPAPQVLERLERRKVQIFRTDLEGAIWLASGEGGWRRRELPD